MSVRKSPGCTAAILGSLVCPLRYSKARAVMPSKVNIPFPNPKKGKARMVLKRPAAMKTKQWKSVPYVRDKKSNYTGQKNDRSQWQRILWDLIPKNDKALVNLLRKDGLLPKWEGKTCPRCGTGKLSALQPGKVGAMPRHRCNAKGCQTYINPHHLHPILSLSTASERLVFNRGW